mmetsp:Transcript_25690/g.60222  ORF Transcript_25690/g.60222 Transcript_25690/m.60222 type:complete len:213 (+) Transcript_25690:991-1629(+)
MGFFEARPLVGRGVVAPGRKLGGQPAEIDGFHHGADLPFGRERVFGRRTFGAVKGRLHHERIEPDVVPHQHVGLSAEVLEEIDGGFVPDSERGAVVRGDPVNLLGALVDSARALAETDQKASLVADSPVARVHHQESELHQIRLGFVPVGIPKLDHSGGLRVEHERRRSVPISADPFLFDGGGGGGTRVRTERIGPGAGGKRPGRSPGRQRR